ncbi:hypothetical protein [Deinococcus hopiensis]|uniref:hypothetical protein n=1 Tax=Deinococcus hopiensis TaxID=309885 RepID=UPI00111C16FD|nr:hypothetical protein [Deinococcus hopiensis]
MTTDRWSPISSAGCITVFPLKHAEEAAVPPITPAQLEAARCSHRRAAGVAFFPVLSPEEVFRRAWCRIGRPYLRQDRVLLPVKALRRSSVQRRRYGLPVTGPPGRGHPVGVRSALLPRFSRRGVP